MIYRGRVDDDAVVAFALATNDRNDLYWRGTAVPPLFTASLILSAQHAVTRTATDMPEIRGAHAGVHGEHDVYFRGPVLPGMALQWEASVLGAKQTRGGVLIVQRTLVSDEHGSPLVEHLWSNLFIGATIDRDVGAEKADHSFPEGARTRPIGRQSVPVDRDQTFRYAGVSSDHIGHAIDDEIARQEGYPGKILQGLCTFAICSGAVVELGAGSDPRRLQRLAARFAAPAFPNRELVVDVYDAGPTVDGGRALAFEATQDGVTVIKHGRAELIGD
ncbi:MAG: MaoC/PaaZ C-terminal domain-containing protein [Acidimicrobiia bacterium]